MTKLLYILVLVALLIPTLAIAKDRVLCEDWLQRDDVLVVVDGGDAAYHADGKVVRMSTTDAYARVERLLRFKWECIRVTDKEANNGVSRDSVGNLVGYHHSGDAGRGPHGGRRQGAASRARPQRAVRVD